MKIFISYRRGDSAYVVDRIRARLTEALGPASVFRDVESIPLGSDFRQVLDTETNGCDVMLVVIGPQWAGITDSNGNKRLFDPQDYTRIEVETGLQRAIPVIPVLVMGLELKKMPGGPDLPESLHSLAFKNGIEVRKDPDFDSDMQRLINNIRQFVPEGTDLERKDFEPETIYIAAGKFWMGNAPANGIPPHEAILTEVELPAYRIGASPITNALFEFYLDRKKISPHPILGWDGQSVPEEMRELPVSGVTWFEALEYCRWLSEETGHDYSLPNEAQWEKACRGGKSFTYPWGDQFDPIRSNHGKGKLAAARAFPPQNDLGLYDLVGNIRQWTCTLWGGKRLAPDKLYEYPWNVDKRRNDLAASSEIWRVVRGSSYLDSQSQMRSAARERQLPAERGFPGKRYGFRVVLND